MTITVPKEELSCTDESEYGSRPRTAVEIWNRLGLAQIVSCTSILRIFIKIECHFLELFRPRKKHEQLTEVVEMLHEASQDAWT